MKRIVSMIVVLSMLLCTAREATAQRKPFSVKEKTNTKKCISSNNQYKKFTFSIYREGDCAIFHYVKLNSYQGKASHLKLPDKIKTSKGVLPVYNPPSRYKYPKRIKKITMSRRLGSTYMGEFSRLPNLKEIRLKKSSKDDYVKQGVLFGRFLGGIWLNIFPRGKKDKTYQVPKKVSVIGHYAFANCKNLKSIKLPKGLMEINDYAFSGCQSLKKVTIPKCVSYIGTGAFDKCPAKVVMSPYMEEVKEKSGRGSHYELFVDSRPKGDENAAIERLPYRDIDKIQPDVKEVEMAVNSKHSLVTHFCIKERWSTLLSDALQYQSSDNKIATVDEHGVVTAKKKGTVKISVKHLYLYEYHNYVDGKYTVKITVK